MPVDPEVLRAGVSRLAKRGSSQVAIEDLFDEVVSAASALFHLSGAGFMMIDDRNALRSVAASDWAGEVLEETQQEFGEGPCIDTFVNDTTIVCADLGFDPRYPKVGPVMATRGVHAVLGVPVRVGGGAIGSLNIYVDEAHQWTEEEIAGLETYGQLLGGLLAAAMTAQHHGQLADQLQYALDYRVVIERAVGFLMARHDVDAVDAFNRLRRAARDRQRRVADLAADVLARRTLL